MNSCFQKLKRASLIIGLAISGTAGAGALAPTNALTFNFTSASGNVTPDVVNGFQQAGALWSSLLSDNVTVNVSIDYLHLGGNTLGQAGSYQGTVSYSAFYAALNADRTSADDIAAVSSLSNSSTFNRLINYTSNNPNGAGSLTAYTDNPNNTITINTANAHALGLYGGYTGLDAEIIFSSDYAWDFNRSDGISAGQYDFIGVAAHEIGHALGFTSSIDELDNSGGTQTASSFTATPLDLFRFSTASTTQNAIDFTVGTTDKYFSLDKGVTKIASFSTGTVNGDTWQASHWQDSQSLGIMDPTTASQEILQITQNDLRAFDAIGWNRVSDPTKLPEPEQYVGTLMVMAFGVRTIVKRKRLAAKKVDKSEA